MRNRLVACGVSDRLRTENGRSALLQTAVSDCAEDQPRRQIARIIHSAAHTAITRTRTSRAPILPPTLPGAFMSRLAPKAALGALHGNLHKKIPLPGLVPDTQV